MGVSRRLRAVLCIGLVGIGGAQAANRERLTGVPAPDLSQVEDHVRSELKAAAIEFSKLSESPHISDRELGSAYGELGGVYHAHRADDSAEACYRNAETLAPQEYRWPYLLGYLYQGQGWPEKATAAYERARELRPNDPPLRLRLSDAYMSLNQLQQVRSLLQPALETQETRGAAAYRLGKVALLEGHYEEAVQWLHRALTAAPQATRVHYQLAMAYRGLGDVAKARDHLAQHGDIEPPFPDPLVQTLEQLVAGARIHLYRAMQAVWAKRFHLAAKEFRQVVALEPENASARVSLARSLYLIGRPREAKTALEAALAQAPDDAQAHYFLGRLLQEIDSDAPAMRHYEAALAADPEHGGAHFFLANALMRAGRFEDAARHYGRAVALLPEDLPPRQLEAIALMATTAHHPLARERLEAAIVLYPDDAVLKQALARLLAASPNAALRDGRRALMLATGLLEQINSIENAETVAMAYAELGRYREATAFQQAALDAAVQWSGLELLPRLQQNLQHYQGHQPCREPWPRHDPVFHPRRIQALEAEAIAKPMAPHSLQHPSRGPH